MRKLMVTTFVSLDGVMQAPGGRDEDRDGGFAHGGWAVPHFDQDMIQLMTAVTRRAGALLIGRRTYDIFAATWPLAGAGDPIGAKMNSVPKYVASRTLGTVSWRNSTLLTGDVEHRRRHQHVRAERRARVRRDGPGDRQLVIERPLERRLKRPSARDLRRRRPSGRSRC
jgi:dihydrofolate reductase